MKLYPDRVLVNLEGEPYKEGTTVLTTRMMIAALLDVTPTDKKLTGDQKMKRFKLQMRLYEQDVASITLDVDEIALVKDLIDTSPGVTPNLYGQIMAQLTGE